MGCPVCGAPDPATDGHDSDCGRLARSILAQVFILAAEAELKGEKLRKMKVPELNLVGNAYLGMAERIFAIRLDIANPPHHVPKEI